MASSRLPECPPEGAVAVSECWPLRRFWTDSGAQPGSATAASTSTTPILMAMCSVAHRPSRGSARHRSSPTRGREAVPASASRGAAEVDPARVHSVEPCGRQILEAVDDRLLVRALTVLAGLIACLCAAHLVTTGSGPGREDVTPRRQILHREIPAPCDEQQCRRDRGEALHTVVALQRRTCGRFNLPQFTAHRTAGD